MPLEIITVAVGIVISLLVFSLVIKVLKASLSTALVIAAILLTLQFFLGIHYEQIWQDFNPFVQKLINTVNQLWKSIN